MSTRRQRDKDFITVDDDLSSDELRELIDEDDEEDYGSDAPAGSAARRAKQARADRKGKGKATQGAGARDSSRKNGAAKGKGQEYSWEGGVERSWDVVQEDAAGSLSGAVSDLLANSKRRRILRDTQSVQRGIIRNVYLVIDLSSAMLVRDFKAPWLDLALQYSREFVTEFFDQNPISQLAIMGTREGGAEKISPMSGNAVDHLKVLQNRRKFEARGEPSLQNVLELARSSMSHLPPHGSKELIIIFGSLTTCDPSNIHKTIADTHEDRIRVNIIGLSAEMKICRDICERTGGTYTVAQDDLYLREHLFEYVAPPAMLAPPSKSAALGGTGTGPISNHADLMLMGFPTLSSGELPGECSCHGKLKSSTYVCARCRSHVCDVPTECRVCGLTLVSSPHLARSFRHLFPIKNYTQVNGPSEHEFPAACFTCAVPFPAMSASALQAPAPVASSSNVSPTGRYACPKCHNHFCIDCDILVHDQLGFCPGCTG